MRAVALRGLVVVALIGVGLAAGWRLKEATASSPSASIVYVANWASLSDATSGGAAAGISNASLLYVTADTLPDATRAALKSLHPTLVVIIGGGLAVSVDVETSIRALGLTTQRIAGSTRFETASLVAAFALAHARRGAQGSQAAATPTAGSHEDLITLVGAGVSYSGCPGSLDYRPLIGCADPNLITPDELTIDPTRYPSATRVFGDFIFQVQPGTRACVAIYDVTVAAPTSEACSTNTTSNPVTVEPTATSFPLAGRKADAYRVEVKLLTPGNAPCPVSPRGLAPACDALVSAARVDLEW